METGGSRSTGETGAYSDESRLSILALLAPDSPRSSPPNDYPGYRLPTSSSPADSRMEHTLSSSLQQDPAGSKAGRLQALLPRPSEQQQPARAVPAQTTRQPGVAVPRRIATIVACENCRAKRTKCDGARPKCSRCARLGSTCEYDAGPDETRSIARKRKYDEMKNDLHDMQELYEYIRSRSLIDVAEVIRRIRANADPCNVLRFLRDGDLLLEASAIGRRGLEVDKEDAVRQLDLAALNRSPIRVAAKPWTEVAGDGLISELVSIFFDTEQPSIATYVDMPCFLEDMRSSSLDKARFCSPALVNIICALSAFSSETARAVDKAQGGCVRERFFTEAKKQIDLEHGKVSLPTVLALYTLFLYSSAAGIDRAGAFYRFTCCEMYRRLRLGSEFPSWINTLDPVDRPRARDATSRAAWGLFCLESISAFIYIQPALIEPPPLPREFCHDPPAADGASQSVFFDSECWISKLIYEIMCHNRQVREPLGSEADISVRLSMYRRLWGWKAPPRGRHGQGFDGLGQSIFLDALFSIAVIALFRPMAATDITLPGGLVSPAMMCVEHCRRLVEHCEQFREAYPEEYDKGCVATLYIFYVCSISLAALLDREPASHEPFVQACGYFHLVARNYPVGRALLRGLQAIALETKVTLPDQCLGFFSDANLANQNFRDVPISYVIPQNNGESDRERPGQELGNLIEKWSAIVL